MTQDDNTNENEVETKDVQDETHEGAEHADENTSGDEPKLTYEEKIAAAKTDAEKFAIANAEAAKNRRLLSKSQKSKPDTVAAKPPTQTESSSSPVDVDERILKAQGMPSELLDKLKKIATLNGTSLIDAQTDELFVAAKEKFEKDKKAQQASMGASRGSGSYKPKVTANTPNIDRAEHMKLAKEAMGN